MFKIIDKIPIFFWADSLHFSKLFLGGHFVLCYIFIHCFLIVFATIREPCPVIFSFVIIILFSG